MIEGLHYRFFSAHLHRQERFMRLRNVWVYTLGLTLAAAAAGQKVATATAGNVTGTVTLDGTAPKNELIKMNADPVCLRQAKGPQSQETYMVGGDGKSLANVFVYV